MEIVQTQIEDIQVLMVKGRLDTLSSTSLKTTLESLIHDNERQFLVDCSELTFISSSGLRVLLSTAKQLGPLKGKIALCAMKAHIREVFDIAGFLALFKVFEHQQEALNRF